MRIKFAVQLQPAASCYRISRQTRPPVHTLWYSRTFFTQLVHILCPLYAVVALVCFYFSLLYAYHCAMLRGTGTNLKVGAHVRRKCRKKFWSCPLNKTLQNAKTAVKRYSCHCFCFIAVLFQFYFNCTGTITCEEKKQPFHSMTQHDNTTTVFRPVKRVHFELLAHT